MTYLLFNAITYFLPNDQEQLVEGMGSLVGVEE